MKRTLEVERYLHDRTRNGEHSAQNRRTPITKREQNDLPDKLILPRRTTGSPLQQPRIHRRISLTLTRRPPIHKP
jgi:hypothetical protein